MDYEAIGTLIVDVVTKAMPLGILFFLIERLVQLFLSLVFPKKYSNF